MKSFKYIIFVSLVLMAFKTGDNKSFYSIPLAAWSVTAGDIDMDGDNDIVVGHNYNFQTEWGGVSIILNEGNGFFYLFDSVLFSAWQSDIQVVNINLGLMSEIIAIHDNLSEENEYITVINDFNLQNISYYSLDNYDGIDHKTDGDINGDDFIDIVFSSNNGQFWGVIYNDGTGDFSLPEYHFVTEYFPTALACGDLNNDNHDDVVVCGQSTEVYFSYPEGFQSTLLETNNYKEGVLIEDFDLDGDNDILTFVGITFANVTSLIMYRNQGNEIFDTVEEFFFQPMSENFFIADFDNDSLKDILFQLFEKTGYIIYYNQGNFQLADSQFVALPPSNPQEAWRNCCSADIDGNGFNDIITVRTLNVFLPDNLVILFNDGKGNFVDEPVTHIEIPNLKDKNPMFCYPNPFFTETTFEFNISENEIAELSVCDLQGRLITSLTNKDQKGGHYTIKWDGLDTHGNPCKPGTYYACLKADGKILQTVKLIKY